MFSLSVCGGLGIGGARANFRPLGQLPFSTGVGLSAPRLARCREISSSGKADHGKVAPKIGESASE